MITVVVPREDGCVTRQPKDNVIDTVIKLCQIATRMDNSARSAHKYGVTGEHLLCRHIPKTDTVGKMAWGMHNLKAALPDLNV